MGMDTAIQTNKEEINRSIHSHAGETAKELPKTNLKK
jgi:hypothetical protein